MFLGKGVPKRCSKFTGEHLCRSAISVKLQSNFIEITLQHGSSPVNLLHIFRTPFLKNTSGRLLVDNDTEISLFISFSIFTGMLLGPFGLFKHSHKKQIVWKLGPNGPFYALMLRTKLY